MSVASASMPASPYKTRLRAWRDERRAPLPYATPPRRDDNVDKRDVSTMAVTGTALASALHGGGASSTQDIHDAAQDADADVPVASVASLPLPSDRTRPSSTSFGAQQPASSSLHQLDALHQRLQSMLAAQADEQQQRDDAGHKQQYAEANSAPRPSNTSDTATSSPGPASSNPLLQQLMALMAQAEQQQRQQAAHSTNAATVLPIAGLQAAAPVTAKAVAPLQATHTTHAALSASVQPSPVQATLPPSNSHSSADFSASAATVHPPSLPAPALPSVAPGTAELAHSHLAEQLRQLSECRQQAVAECVAVQSRLLAAVAQLHALHAHYAGELWRIEDEYGRAVEQCKAQHSQRFQMLHER